jgi:glycosyltransferase involved in cell wall biosynthesis
MSRQLKICIITTAFPRWQKDGRGTFVFEAAKALARRGNIVRVIAMHNPGAVHHEVMDGVEVIRPHYLPDRWEILQKDSSGLPLEWRNNPWSRLAILPFLFMHTLATAYWSRGYDIIHANWTLSGVSAWITQWLHHCPYFVTVHGSDIFQATHMFLPRILTRRALGKSRGVIAVSQALADEVIKMGVNPEKVHVISNGVDLGKFSFGVPEMREPIILYVGSLIERKCVHVLITAFSLVINDLPDYRLVIVGEGILSNSLKQTVWELGLDRKVDFTGFQTQEQVHDWMRRAKLFVLPSNEEGQGVVLLEALASGTPCIGSLVGGIPDVITPGVGLLVPPDNPGELCRAILEIINSDDWENMSCKARQRAEDEYNWDHIAQKILRQYERQF